MGQKKTEPPPRTIRVHEDVYDDAMIGAGYARKGMTQYLRDLLRPLLQERNPEFAREYDRKKLKAKPRPDAAPVKPPKGQAGG